VPPTDFKKMLYYHFKNFYFLETEYRGQNFLPNQSSFPFQQQASIKTPPVLRHFGISARVGDYSICMPATSGKKTTILVNGVGFSFKNREGFEQIKNINPITFVEHPNKNKNYCIREFELTNDKIGHYIAQKTFGNSIQEKLESHDNYYKGLYYHTASF
jgi:hypothetical protein